MWQRFTERARRVVFFAQEEAGRLGENYLGSEHLLLGLVREDDSAAAWVLDRLGISIGRVRSETERQVTRGNGRVGADMQLTPRAKRVIDLAYDEARQLNNNYIGTEHLLLGVVREGEGLGGRILHKLGVTLDNVRAVVLTLQDSDSDSANPAQPSQAEIVPRRIRQAFERFVSKAREPEFKQAAEASGLDIEKELEALESMLKAAGEQSGEAGAAQSSVDKTQVARDIMDVRGLLRNDHYCLKGKSFLSVADLSLAQMEGMLLVTDAMASGHRVQIPVVQYTYPKCLAMIFEKPSLRTRVSFDVGMQQLGGIATILGPAEIGLGSREAVPDVARNLERMVDCIMARVFDHHILVELRDNCSIPIINGLSDLEHPCQALADLYTIQQKKGKLEGLKLAWIGDGNNVLHSLLLAGGLTGLSVSAACPKGYEPLPGIVERARELAGGRATFTITNDTAEAAQDADAVYTDVWTSMGQEKEQIARIQAFRPYQVNAALMALAKPDALFMHCLPAHRGDEVTDEVMDGPQSVVFDQAENRLHAQKAVLALLIGV
jgi:ornithine carbamoyltransferase